MPSMTAVGMVLKRNEFKLNRHFALGCVEHDLFRKPVSIFRDHALAATRPSPRLPHATAPRITGAVVEAPDVIAVKALVSDLHPRAQRHNSRQFFHRKANGLRRGGKAPITERLTCPALALRHEEFG